MRNLIAVFFGGSIGSLLRYFISRTALKYDFSYQATFFINILGCLFIGFISYLALKRANIIATRHKLFLNTGIAGGFTTFSTFSYEAFSFISGNHISFGLMYAFLSCVIGILAAFIGVAFAHHILKTRLKAKKVAANIARQDRVVL